MFQQYRYISARTLLGLPKLARCQSLPQNTWTPADKLWHLVFISHRWGSQDDPDPFGTQLIALQQLAQRLAHITAALEDERTGIEAVQERLALIPSLMRQGTLQAAHLIFRSLCYGEELAMDEVDRVAGDGILDVIGFWYDYSCLPQDPKTSSEEREFAQTLQGIGDMILSPRVSTLVLRKEADDYLSRGWCFAESMIASSKEDTNKPMVLRTDRWDQPIEIFNAEAFAQFKSDAERALTLWEDVTSSLSVWECFQAVINTTALPFLLKLGQVESDFALTTTDTVGIASRLLTIQMWLGMVQDGMFAELDLFGTVSLSATEAGIRVPRSQ